MAESDTSDEMLTVAQAVHDYGLKRATLYRYARLGKLKTYRRGMDRRTYLRRHDLESLREFRESAPKPGFTPAAIQHALAVQRAIFGDRVLTTPSAELIEEARRERLEELP